MTGPTPGTDRLGAVSGAEGGDGNRQDLLNGWSDLIGGDRVEVVRAGFPVEFGVVDAVMPDGSIVWLWMDGGRGRAMLFSSDGIGLHPTGPRCPVISDGAK
jgi:hypothetical protein